MSWPKPVLDSLLELISEGLSNREIAKKLSGLFPNEKFSKDSVKSKRTRLNRLGINAYSVGSTQEPSYDEKVYRAKVRAIAAQERSAEKKQISDTVKFTMLCDTMTEAITPLDFVQQKVKIPKSKGTKAEEAVLLLSDFHFGKKTPTYDLDTALQRFSSIFEAVYKIVTLHRNSYPIKKLWVMWLGDIVDGETIFPTQPHHIDNSVVNQIFSTAKPITSELANAANFFEEVEHVCVPGNHGRGSKYMNEVSNFDRIFYKVLEIASANIPNMKWSIPNDWYAKAKVLNTEFLLVHGHQIKMIMNLPWYGITTRTSRWGLTEKVGGFDIICMGHFHTGSKLAWNKKTVFTNGTMVSGDEFALEVMGLESTESQWFLGIHPERGNTWCYELKP